MTSENENNLCLVSWLPKVCIEGEKLSAYPWLHVELVSRVINITDSDCDHFFVPVSVGRVDGAGQNGYDVSSFKLVYSFVRVSKFLIAAVLVIDLIRSWRSAIELCCCNSSISGIKSHRGKVSLMKKAYSTLILCLGDRVLRKVTKERTAAGIWTKLTNLYMTKSLANILYLKKLYMYYMSLDQILMLLTPLPSSFENLVETLLYGMESLTMKDVLATLNSRELKKKTKGTKKETGNGYM
nr:retrovirus-related Pol polyprotein from transposon TNT 1-94 [Tanacetum cinerariifolium]